MTTRSGASAPRPPINPSNNTLDPLVVAVAAILNTFTLVWALTYVTNVSIIVQFLIVLVGLGVAIDYPALGQPIAPTTNSAQISALRRELPQSPTCRVSQQ